MNTEAILDLAEFIERLTLLTQTDVEDADMRSYTNVPPGRWFRMDVWLTQTQHEFDCGTIGCIAGWAAWHWDMAVKKDQDRFMINDRSVGRVMGLSQDQTTQLFLPPSLHGIGYKNVTPYMAGKVLRHLADTGVVDWSVIRYCSVCGGDLNQQWHDNPPCCCPEGEEVVEEFGEVI